MAARSLHAFLAPLFVLATLVFTGGEANACGTCTVGDPTLTVMGVGQPKAARVRTSVAIRRQEDRVGEQNVDALELREQRLEFGVAYSPTDRLTASVMMPLVHLRVTEINLAERNTWAPGDLEIRLRGMIFSDRAVAPRHTLSAIVGLELPTSTTARGTDGLVLPLEFQAGSGSWDPIAGASYNLFANPWSLYLTALATFPTSGHANAKGGMQFRQLATVQFQPWSVFGFRAGAEFRVEGATTERGIEDPDSGGHVTYLSAGLVALPHSNVVLHVAASIPVIERFSGTHDEGLSISAGIIYEI